MNGYEIAVTEAYEDGWIFRCDPVQLAMLFAAMVYESRRFDDSAPPTRTLKGIARAVHPAHGGLRLDGAGAPAWAHRRGCRTSASRDPSSSGPRAWPSTASSRKTSLAPGDLVRVLRMTIQLLRQVEHSLAAEDPTREGLRAARERIDRDVVDARRQLELG